MLCHTKDRDEVHRKTVSLRPSRPSFDIYVDASLARYAGRWIESAIGGGRSG